MKEDKPLFSTSIEKLLIKAAREEDFRTELLRNIDRVFDEPEISLTRQDKILLKSIPSSGLKTMIENLSHQYILNKEIDREIHFEPAVRMARASYSESTRGIRSDLI